jgi:hypothetical protein
MIGLISPSTTDSWYTLTLVKLLVLSFEISRGLSKYVTLETKFQSCCILSPPPAAGRVWRKSWKNVKVHEIKLEAEG